MTFQKRLFEILVSLSGSFPSGLFRNLYFAFAREVILNIIQKMQYSEPDIRMSFAQGRIIDILKFAQKHVSYWAKNIEKNRGIFPLNSTEEISFLPILERSMLAERLSLVSSDRVPSYHLGTSGTSGPPVLFYVDRNLFLLRAIEVDYIVRMLFHTRIYSILRLSYQDMPWSVYQGLYMNPLFLDKLQLTNILSSCKPTVLYGTVSHITLLADFFKKEQINYQFILVLTRSEHLDLVTRQYFENVFGGKAYNMYASREFGVIAQECMEQNGLHVNEERVLIEILNDKGRKTQREEVGNIVVTSLWNYSLPFIRYKIGDRGKFLTGECKCGFKTRRIEIIGRLSDFIYLPSGRKIPYIDFFRAISLSGLVKNFQFFQETPKSMTVRVMFYNNEDSPQILTTLAARFKEVISKLDENDFEIRFEKVENIPLTTTGKLTRLISKIKDAPLLL